MALNDAAALLVGLAGALVIGALMSAAPAAFESLFTSRSPLDLGWPTGVQEDDDMRWSWRTASSAPDPTAPAPEPDASNDSSYEVRPTAIHPRLPRPRR